MILCQIGLDVEHNGSRLAEEQRGPDHDVAVLGALKVPRGAERGR